MTNKARRRFDAFTFALGGVSIASSFAAIPVVANDRIAKAWDSRLAATGRSRSASRSEGGVTSLVPQRAAGQILT